MSEPPVTAQDVRASAEAHRELGPEYGDAVVESFLARIEKQIDARVDERLAAVGGRSRRPRRPTDPVRLGRYRSALAGAVAGSVVVGVPLTILAAHLLSAGRTGNRLIVLWVVLLVVYGLAAYRLRRR
jgi:hypothetical protein